jgi:hypothetical protein
MNAKSMLEEKKGEKLINEETIVKQRDQSDDKDKVKAFSKKIYNKQQVAVTRHSKPVKKISLHGKS